MVYLRVEKIGTQSQRPLEFRQRLGRAGQVQQGRAYPGLFTYPLAPSASVWFNGFCEKALDATREAEDGGTGCRAVRL
jgi:hypothetical protein